MDQDFFTFAAQLAYLQAAETLGLPQRHRPQLYRPCASCASYATLQETRVDGVQLFRCENLHVQIVTPVRW